MNNKKSLKVIDIPKGINIVIKNEVQPPQEKQKKRRKRRIKKDNLDLLKLPSAPSYIPPGNIAKVQQYRGSSIIGPTQSQLQQQLLTAPQPQQLLPPPPQLLQITAPPQAQQQPINFNFKGFNPMMPMEWGGGSGPTIREIEEDEELVQALPEDKQEELKNIQIEEDVNKKIEASKIPQTLKLTEDEKEEMKEKAIKQKQGRQWGTKDSNKLIQPREKYRGNEFYKENYKNNIERKLKNTKLSADERKELNDLLTLINGF